VKTIQNTLQETTGRGSDNDIVNINEQVCSSNPDQRTNKEVSVTDAAKPNVER
jgi:hypothetical protein